ncbi:MAG: helix-turn-helix domain-containing protein [Bacteroides sp.]|nr:helix-turn-helix domain-containing protein [Bacteroides sp.]
METFKIIQPTPMLAPYIKNYWLLRTACDSPTLARTVPTGMMNLIFHRGNRLYSIHDHQLHPRAFLSGQEKQFADLQYKGEIDMLAVVFHPAGVRAFFDLPIHTLKGLRVTASDLEDKELAQLESTLTSTESDPHCILLVEQFLLKRLCKPTGHHLNRIENTIRLISSGQTDIARLADTVCLSNKQFQRIFSEYIGANPKEFSRIIRFQRALHTLETRPQISLTDLTYECGYFDQSHLIKEFKTLSGYTPGEYTTVCTPTSDYFH